MKLTKTTPPPSTDEWTAVLEKIAQEPGQWVRIEEHGMAEKTVRPWAYKVRNGKYVTANRVADQYDGTFDTAVHEGKLQIVFNKN